MQCIPLHWWFSTTIESFISCGFEKKGVHALLINVVSRYLIYLFVFLRDLFTIVKKIEGIIKLTFPLQKTCVLDA